MLDDVTLALFLPSVFLLWLILALCHCCSVLIVYFPPTHPLFSCLFYDFYVTLESTGHKCLN